MKILRILWAALACAAALLPAAARAQSSCPVAADVATWTATTAREALICVADLSQNVTAASCSPYNASCKALAERRKDPAPFTATEAARFLIGMREALDAVTANFPYARPLYREIDRWTKDLATGASSAGRVLPPEIVRQWEYDTGSGKILDSRPNEVDLRGALNKECTNADACTRALRSSAQTVIYGTLAQTLAGDMIRDLRAQGAAYIEMLDKRWDKYFDASRFQYPWELAINDRRFKNEGRGGFISPPEDQWIFMHPSVGMRYNAKGEQTFEALLMLEVAGIHRWKWVGADRDDKLGGSLVVAWAGQHGGNGETKPGVGFIAYMPKSWAVGLLRHTVAGEKTTSLIVNADIAKLFENKDQVRKTLKGLLD